MIVIMEFSNRNSRVVVFAAVSLAVLTMLATITMVASIPQAMAQSPPISVVGNPHGFSTGPPIPSCQIASVIPMPAFAHIEGCRATP
jgi:hypothetical protein